MTTNSQNNVVLDGGIISDGTPNSIVSDFMGYGSYSGSDISVIVHYPATAKVEKQIEKDRAEIQYRLAKEERDLLAAQRRDILSPQQEVISKDKINTLQTDLQNLDQKQKGLVNLPTSKKLAELHTLSWSVYRGKAPVRTLGSVYPRSIVRGSRTIAGSMIFTIFHQHVLHEVLDLNLSIYNTGTSDHDPYRKSTNLPDQLPPLDLTIRFANEYGAVSTMGLYGVEFFQEGATFSIEDIFSESVMQYQALDIDPIRIAGSRELDGQGVTDFWATNASRLPYEQSNPKSYRIRRNPFI